jgi:NAD(P)-dependent dehydrogenase (short-subunit alcohol dehydrogenase family)
MSGLLEGKVAVISGGATGIRLATASVRHRKERTRCQLL